MLKKAMAPQPERLELGLKPPYLPRTLPSGGSQWQGGTKMEVRCIFFPRQMIHMILVIFDDAIHSHSAVCLVEHCFGPVFLEILCFIKGLMMFNDV